MNALKQLTATRLVAFVLVLFGVCSAAGQDQPTLPQSQTNGSPTGETTTGTPGRRTPIRNLARRVLGRDVPAVEADAGNKGLIRSQIRKMKDAPPGRD
jgi:hypothetical protein